MLHCSGDMSYELISQQHSEILDEVDQLIQATETGNTDNMLSVFEKFSSMVSEHFSDEEAILRQNDSPMLQRQEKEHGVLRRMFDTMKDLMETSVDPRWRAAVILQTIEGLRLHFRQEDVDFPELVQRPASRETEPASK